jgi:hypothetical protein
LTNSTTACHPSDLLEKIHITHPFHPRRGEVLDILDHLSSYGDDRVYFRELDGRRSFVPASWTSAIPEDPGIRIAVGKCKLQLRDFVELADEVERQLELNRVDSASSK